MAPSDLHVTAEAEQQAHATGKLNPLVDPAEYGVIRPSRPRFIEQADGTWRMTVGTPMPLESRIDTTGSMGGNVDVAMRVMADLYELCASVLPGYDLQIATGIFGDTVDNFVLCRPQFEAEAPKIVEQLTLMVPERQGGDEPEDPDYGIFGGAYLMAAYINRIGLKGYDFTISDAPGRGRISAKQLVRIFSKDVFDKVAENGFKIDRSDLPETAEIVKDLLKRAHAFFLQVGDDSRTQKFWTNIYGKDRVIVLPTTELLPQVEAAIIGLTEGTLNLQSIEEFLTKNNVSKTDATKILRSVANIPIGAQAALPNFNKRPKEGDIFETKTSLWPIEAGKTVTKPKPGKKPSVGGNTNIEWL